MAVSLHDLNSLLSEPEGERLEFKSAQRNYPFDRLVEYCAAIANEGGGKIVLGITDRRPREIVGTAAFDEPGRTVAGLMERLRIRVSVSEIQHPDGRVLVFEVSGRPVGLPVGVDGKYFARSGDALRAMTQEELKQIFDEGGPDYSAQIEPDATLDHLDPGTVELFRQQWRKKSQNPALDSLSVERLLTDAELLIDGKLPRAALIFLGTKAALGRFIPQAEVIFEYRSSETHISHQQRIELRQGFLGILDQLWNTINLRNDVIQYQDGLFRRDLSVFNELVVREAVLNALTHRDYRLPSSVFIRQFPRKLEIVSPGGLPAGVTIENLLYRQSPRNRRIAESCARCGLVERSGQGVDRIYEESLREGKPKPDFFGTDEYQVSLTISGEVQNPDFVRFLEKVSAQQSVSFSVEDLLVLDSLMHGTAVEQNLRRNLDRLVDRGIVERVGRGRGSKQVLSRKFYSFLGKKGIYTRHRGLDRETNKHLLLKHIEDSGTTGAKLGDLLEVLKDLSKDQVQTLLRELKREGRAHVVGSRRAGRWFIRPGQQDANPN